MASSPRTGRSSPALFAVVIGAVLILGVIAMVVLGFDPLRVSQGVISSFFPPQAVTDRGEHIRQLYDLVFGIAVVIFFVVEGLIIWTVVRYRRKAGDDELPPQTHGNAVAEVVWTVVPTLIVAVLFVASWLTLNTVDAASAQPQMKVRATAAQFLWSFQYLPNDYDPVTNKDAKPLLEITEPEGPDGGLTLPVGRTIHLYLQSPDVIHAFYVPQFLFKRDIVPGRTTAFDFTVDAADAGQTFRGQCAELCGTLHSTMLFDVKALTAPEFDTWLADKITKANATPPPAPSGGPAGSGAPGGAGETLKITAQNIAYEQTNLTVKAGAPFKIEFDNQDNGVPHNVAIHLGSSTGTEVFKGAIFPGVATQTYDVKQLDAGSYAFVCSVHPTMTGTLTVQ
jgi:cytochrome c oxidase subunit 2